MSPNALLSLTRANIIGLRGGLGNQLFQYSFALWLQKRTGCPSRLDLSAYRGRPEALSLSEFGLHRVRPDGFAGLLPHPGYRHDWLARACRSLRGPREIFTEGDPAAGPPRFPGLVELSAPRWYYGYWQHPRVVEEVLEDVRAEIGVDWNEDEEVEPIAVHIRRGDMVHHVSILDPSYYPRALRRLREVNGLAEDTPIAVYSDDPDWCRREMGLGNARFVVPGSASADLVRLARHDFLVLSGSTFSWWAASLRHRAPDTVVAPEPFSMVPHQRLERTGWVLAER